MSAIYFISGTDRLSLMPRATGALLCSFGQLILSSQANVARAPLLKGDELLQAMNASRPEYDMDKYRQREMLLGQHFSPLRI